jgi:regulator of sigma E protease
MAGELPNEERTGAEYELHSKSAWKRFWIFSAGSLMNLLVVFPICIFMFWIGVDQVGNNIGEIRPGSPEWNAGIESGHRMVGLRVQKTPGPVNNKSDAEWGPVKNVTSLSAYRETLIGLSPGQHVKLMMSGNQSEEVKEYVLDPEDPIEQQQNVLPLSNVVQQVLDRSPADNSGIRPDDQILAINGYPIRSTRDIRRAVEQHVDPRVRYVVKRGDGDMEIHELAVPQGVPYLIKLDGQTYPVYHLTDEMDLKDRLDLSSSDRIVRVNDTVVATSSDAASAVYNGSVPLTDVEFVRAPFGPVSVRLKRQTEDSITKKTVSLYPNVTKRPDPMTSLLIKPEVSDVRTGSPAERAGLRDGDLIKNIDGHRVASYYHLSLWLKDRGGDEITLTYERDGTEQTTKVTPRTNAFGEGEIGIMIDLDQSPASLPNLPETSGFARSGFQQGDRVVALHTKDGKQKDLSSDGSGQGGVRLLQKHARAHSDGLTLSVRRTENGQETTRKITYSPRKTRSGIIGVRMQPQMFTERLGVVSGIRSGINRGAELYTLTVLGIQKMFQSSEAASQGLSGPVRIASISYRAAEQDVGQFLKLLAMISISLGILNLLPLPPLDGGHILFLLIEVVRGKPLGEEVLYKIQLAGFLFFIGLFILITYNDIVNLMG